MPAKLVFALEVGKDLAEAYEWYEERRVGLGEEFLSCVEACVEALARTPELHPIVHEDYRRALVRRFPYAIFYEVVGESVTIYCVFHTSREPAKWQKRLR
ncbi:MAG: type II toxin-antitoxin system RelE/ParE family toxin [Planctomycetes bacterium]|nr:type II toxin-antitoxin system RelE/ParE family toxin [Planctomycetota bacterium]